MNAARKISAPFFMPAPPCGFQRRCHGGEGLFNQRLFPNKRQPENVQREQQVAEQKQHQADGADAQERQRRFHRVHEPDVRMVEFQALLHPADGERQNQKRDPEQRNPKVDAREFRKGHSNPTTRGNR